MKRLIMLLLFAASAPFAFAGSNSYVIASQKWVRDYVSTNSTPGVATNAVTESWVRDFVARYFATNVSAAVESSTDYSSNTLQGVVRSFKLAGATTLASCTNEAYSTISAVTNLNAIVLAPIAANLYTNAVAGVYMAFTGGVFDLHDGAVSYVSGTNITRVTKLTCATNGTVSVFSANVSDADFKKAKGE